MFYICSHSNAGRSPAAAKPEAAAAVTEVKTTASTTTEAGAKDEPKDDPVEVFFKIVEVEEAKSG
jgi:hypothetical protein